LAQVGLSWNSTHDFKKAPRLPVHLVRPSMTFAQMLRVWSCVLAAAVAVAPPAVMPPQARPGMLPSTVVSQVTANSAGMVAAPAANVVSQDQFAPRFRSQPTMPAHGSLGNTEDTLVNTLSSSPVGADEKFRAVRAAQFGYQEVPQPSDVAATSIAKSLGVLALAVMATVVAAARWWSRKGQAVQAKEIATEMMSSSSMLWSEQPKVVVAAFASEEAFDPGNSKATSSASGVKHGQTLLVALQPEAMQAALRRGGSMLIPATAAVGAVAMLSSVAAYADLPPLEDLPIEEVAQKRSFGPDDATFYGIPFPVAGIGVLAAVTWAAFWVTSLQPAKDKDGTYKTYVGGGMLPPEGYTNPLDPRMSEEYADKDDDIYAKSKKNTKSASSAIV